MDRVSKTKQQLLQENRELKNRFAECEDTLEAIRTGVVDALVVSDAEGERIFTLQSVDYSYRVMVENMNEGAVILDKNGIIVFTNKTFSDLAGREMSALIGTLFVDLLSGSLPDVFSTFFKECTVGSYRGEFSIAREQGGALPVLISGTNFKIDGKPNVCLIVSDLRDRKDAEHKLQKAYEAVEKKVRDRTLELRQKEEEFRSLSENSPDSIARFDMDLRNLYMNPEAKKISGMDVTGKTWREAGLPQDLIAFWEERLKNVIKTGKSERVESSYQSPDGTSYILSSTIAPEFDGKGNVSSILVVTRDITARKRSEEMLAQRAKDLAALNTELKNFSNSISHDLRAPLRAMKSFSCILLEDHSFKLDAEGRDILKRIDRAADKMGELIDDMLSLSKISRQEMSLQEIDMRAIADSIVKELRQAEPERKVDVVIAQELKATGDARLMHIALSNLFGNAWKYTSKKPVAKIEFGTMEKSGEMVYFIRDNGVGFDMAQANRLFAPFQRLHSESEFPGTGIGLAIVNRVIQRHEGRIWGESDPGKGATFYFTLFIDKDNHQKKIRRKEGGGVEASMFDPYN